MQKHLSAAGARPAARIITLALAMLIAACQSSSTGQSSSPPSTRYPLTIQESNGSTVTIAQRPVRIVSLSPSATEMLFAINAGPQVIAVDEQSNYPSTAPVTKLSGFTPNVEAIAAYRPDLVVAADDTGGLVHALSVLSIPTLIEPAARNLDDSYAQVEQLGEATSRQSEAQGLVKQMRSQITAAVATITKPSRRLKFITSSTTPTIRRPRRPSSARSTHCWGSPTSPTKPQEPPATIPSFRRSTSCHPVPT